MRGATPVGAGSLALAFVLCSSVLGLVVKPLLFGVGDAPVDARWDVADARRFFGDVWGESVVADLVFVAGSVAAAVATVEAARRVHAGVAPALGFALNWVVYFLSFELLRASAAFSAGGAFRFVAEWGWPGLVFGAAAPVLWVLAGRRREEAPAAEAPVEA